MERLYRSVLRRLEAEGEGGSRARAWARLCVKYGIFPTMLARARLEGDWIVYVKRGRERRVRLDPRDAEELRRLGLPSPRNVRAIALHVRSLLSPLGLRLVDIKLIREALGLEPPSGSASTASLRRIGRLLRGSSPSPSAKGRQTR